MGRRKKTGLAAKPLNVRLHEESRREIKRIAAREGAFESDVHRELVDEALRARRARAGGGAAGPPAGGDAEALARVEKALSELAGPGVEGLREEVRALASRVAQLSEQVALLAGPPKRRKARDEQDGLPFS